MTYSIVARDASGALGVGIQSHWFCVGDGAPVGAPRRGRGLHAGVHRRAYGPDGLALLAAGRSARETVEALVAADPGRDRRQVGVVDRDGAAFAFTGERCVGHAAHCVGDGVTAQANLVASPAIPEAMVSAFEAAPGELAERLLAALDAGEEAGGDLRGRQAAALLVLGEDGGSVDLRVDDHAEPLPELRRLLGLRRAYDAIERSMELAGAGDADADAALPGLEAAAATLGGNPEAAFWAAILLARTGRLPEARERLGAASPRAATGSGS